MNALQLPFKFDASTLSKEIDQFQKKDYYDIYNPSVQLKKLWAKHLIEPMVSQNLPVKFMPNESLLKCPYLLSVLETFKCEKETFRIHTLEAHSHIKAHRDIGYCFEQGFVRIHIPVQTSDLVKLVVNGELIKMEKGECWYCNFNEVHEVHNDSTKERIHLIMDCRVNEWLKEIFQNATKNT